ncbi:hypothetical protein FDI14_gp061 [Mycobacterium phage SirDuracell]|uniref:Uncharacterized protein n=1 Tax=Mycobacterium phage SirDuracell TaxID=1034116 RepID=G1D5S6_9CAUD|nr:hypothetical protein FDI14_gp061 [Mycobacterium phage SirDuracell]ASZ73550.1 hypothetical protein SEA_MADAMMONKFISH_63 [Mycobacterium phage MadamMonkfish]ATN91667.1 hypothetical protein SEA_SASSAY_57 [Mycobacterium phage Sassay]ATN92482.1 hypothetical protein SEA_WILLEZ_57 [Mycobacterium phage Willez]ATN92626.1 hypothetical protein SEA_YASSJOHNNY_59 [Mycobacterium phage YassJohnny]AXH48771.1 hypothetical protein SEA_SHEREKHAN_61 [Mycobacterium phage ShereKhan]AXH49964.1 hypothetical protei
MRSRLAVLLGRLYGWLEEQLFDPFPDALSELWPAE